MNDRVDDKLLIYNQEGFVPGPGEPQEDFIKRVEYCQNLRHHLSAKLPFTPDMEASVNPLTQMQNKALCAYDIAPLWVPVFFSNYQLSPWQGGCAWIFQLSDLEPTAAFFQLRKAFKRHPSYLGIYKRDELLAHELVHVGRMMFEEPHFEEILAYRTSKSSWRSWLGPLVQSSKESAWFVFLLLPIILLDLYLLIEGDGSFYWQSMWLKSLPLALICAAILRLYRRQTIFERALHNLRSLFLRAEAVIYRLTDAEIYLFATLSPQEILQFIAKEPSLRWQVIRQAYGS